MDRWMQALRIDVVKPALSCGGGGAHGGCRSGHGVTGMVLLIHLRLGVCF